MELEDSTEKKGMELEGSSEVKGGKKEMTAEEIVNALADRPSVLYLLLMTTLVAFNTMCAFVAYFPNFGGFINYNKWSCNANSTNCKSYMETLAAELTNLTLNDSSIDYDIYNKSTLCGLAGDGIVYKEDWTWTTGGRSSYAIDWGLWCDRDFIRNLIASMYFAGAFFGTTVGGVLYDVLGRRKGALIGYAVLITATFVASAPTNEYVFIACRVLQGVGVFTGFSGMFVLAVEFTAVRYRTYLNTVILILWAVGYLLVDCAGYLIKQWNWLGVLTGCLLGFTMIPLALMSESPRYYLVCKNDPESAMNSLKFLKKLTGGDLDLDNVTLKAEEGEEVKEEDEEPTFKQTLQDFFKYEELLIQLVFQMFMWCVAGFIYYGFSFSWGNLSDDLYISYLFAALGEIIAYCVMTFPLETLGRKYTMLLLFAGASFSFWVAMIPLKGKLLSFTLEQISCLFGSMCAAAAFGSIYLYTTELSPTSHRGKMLGICSFAARIGSFAGPYASLLFDWNKTFTLALFATLALVGACFNLRLPETKGIPTPNSAEEVQRRSGRKVTMTEQVVENPVAGASV